MADVIQMDSLDLATISAIVAALVTVFGNAFNIDKRYRALLALFFSFGFIFIPNEWLNRVISALVVGLTASGVYSQVKPRNEQFQNGKTRQKVFKKEKDKTTTEDKKV